MTKAHLAPIYDYTDLPFRIMCQRHGADSCCYPMVNSDAISRNPEKIHEIDSHPDEANAGIQIVGGDSEMVGHTAKLITDEFYWIDYINLNAGCPSPRTMRCGGGSELLKKPNLIRKILSKMTRNPKRVSVKIRLLPKIENTLSLCRMIADEGADFLVVHGRTTAQGYSANADFDSIRTIHEELNIPVIGNGDIKTIGEGYELVNQGVCDSFMIGRAAMANPAVFEDGRQVPSNLLKEYVSIWKEYNLPINYHLLKMKAIRFSSGMVNASAIRKRITFADTVDGIINALDVGTV